MSSNPSPHPSSLKISRVALQWSETNHDSSCSFLTTPDPSDARIVFESQTSPVETNTDLKDGPTGVFLQLSIPLKLKGIFVHAPVHVHIHPSQIQSPAYHDDIDVPETIRAKMPGRLARFSMTLSEPVRLIIPSNTPSPLRARSRASGQVLDALRSLGRATQLSIYLTNEEASRSHLQHLCSLLAAGRGVPLPPYTETFRLFGGSGGCQWAEESPPPPSTLHPSAEEDHDSLPPPRYDELGPGPPMPPISTKSESQGTKRQRHRRSTSSTCSETSAFADAGLQVKKPDLRASPPRLEPATESSAVLQRLTLLELLVQAQARQIEALLADNRQQKDRLRECEADIGQVREAAERAHGRVEELELEMAGQRDDLERLEGEVAYCREWQEEDTIAEVVAGAVSDRIADAVTEAVTERIATRGFVARNISFSLGDE
ncbi:hypothetical protein PG996_006514 [Apiospora saccharicola]|uniref:Uncharacterized protein n=1 Tax=Apiospora saccharicola TaxID=335842 RepID=A0ABR1VPI6_9PEZI